MGAACRGELMKICSYEVYGAIAAYVVLKHLNVLNTCDVFFLAFDETTYRFTKANVLGNLIPLNKIQFYHRSLCP